MARRPPDLSVLRTIQFFRIYSEKRSDALVRFNVAQLCRNVKAVEAMADPYFAEEDIDSYTTAYLNDPGDTDRFILGRSRFRSRPLTIEGHTRSPLKLKTTQGLLEPIHVRFFAHNVMAAEYNDQGPRATKLRALLQDKFPGVYDDLKIEPLLDKDAVERLRQLRELTLFEFSVDKAALDLSPPPANFFDALKPTAEASGSSVVSLVLKVTESDEKLDKPNIMAAVKWLLGLNTGVHSLKVKGRPEPGRAMVDLDLLSERLVTKSRFLRIDPTSRVIDDNDAFTKMERAHREVKDRITSVEIVADRQ